MGCCGDREKQEYLRKEQRWEYINLDDFKSSSCLAPFAYGWLWAMLIVSVSVYAVDTFTCVNLIVFDKWSGQIQPAIPFRVARWVFTGCIILSFVLLIYRWVRAVRVMKQGGVAKSYLDPLAVRIQSIRMGSHGRGWKRFLVFAELTKSRKGADYVALFAYFSFEAWLRIVLAEGPRQVINAITLYSVMKAKLIPEGEHAAPEHTSPILQFFKNVGYLTDNDRMQAIILFGMLWTLIIWVLAAISLAVSVLLYLIFLWHHIPANEGGLTNYCRNKINRRMERVVRVIVDKALKKENELQNRADAKAARAGVAVKKQPTLPNISTASMPSLSRQTTMTTLPEYESRPLSSRNSSDTLPPLPTSFIDGRPPPRRQMTQSSDASWSSFNSNAPLLHQNGDFAQTPIDRMQTPSSATSGPWSARSMPGTPGPRSATANSMRNGPGPYQADPFARPGTAASAMARMRQPSAEDTMFSPIGSGPGNGPLSVAPNHDEANGSYFPPVGNGEHSAPGPGPLRRAQTFQDPSMRPFSPQSAPFDRSLTSSVPPPRSYTPGGLPPRRPYPPGGMAPDRALNYSVPPPERSYTPAGQPLGRGYNASTSSTGRSTSPPQLEPTLPMVDFEAPISHVSPASQSPPRRTMTPANKTEYQPFSAVPGPVTTIRSDTPSNAAGGTYTAFNPRAASSTPKPATSGRSSTSEHSTSTNTTVRSFSRPLPANQHNKADRHSDMSDILDSY